MKQTHYDSVMFACILKLTIETTIYYKNECLKFAKTENKMQQAKLQSVTNDSQRFPPPMSKQRRNRFFFFFFFKDWISKLGSLMKKEHNRYSVFSLWCNLGQTQEFIPPLPLFPPIDPGLW